MLVSRDEQSCLVVSYKEIKRCVETAFRYVGYLFIRTVADGNVGSYYQGLKNGDRG
jgi:hypothetical protein